MIRLLFYCNFGIKWVFICIEFYFIQILHTKHAHTHTHTLTNTDQLALWLVFANGPRDRGSIPGWVISKTQKIKLDASFLNTQYHKVWIKSNWSNLLHIGVVAIEKGAFGSPSTTVEQLYIYRVDRMDLTLFLTLSHSPLLSLSLTLSLSLSLSLSAIAFSRSSLRYPVSTHNWWI